MNCKLLTALLAILVSLTSCIREEALNTECDILGVEESWINSLPEGFLVGNPVIRNESVTFLVKDSSDVSALNPQFTITPNAVLRFRENGVLRDFVAEEKHDFTTPQTYNVLSEDGNWNKDYTVSFEYPHPIDSCDFEDFAYDPTGKYQVLLQRQNDGSLSNNIWDSGNAGFSFTGQGTSPEVFPTTFVDDGTGVSGRFAKLCTRSTGSLGALVGMPIAAGNLFVGEFDMITAMSNPLGATKMGKPLVHGEPKMLSGWYKYTPGEKVIDRQQQVLDQRDSCDIYAVLFEIDPNKFVPLHGDDVKTSERIVSIAQMDDPGEPAEWTYFELPFLPMNGKTFSKERMQQGGYAIAVVMTSSRGGAYFRGAPGSTMCVDNIKITWN